MIQLKIEYKEGMKRLELDLNLYLHDLRMCYVEWMEKFKKLDLVPLSEETFLEIIESLKRTGMYLSLQFSINLLYYY